jgi:hypothetical protein
MRNESRTDPRIRIWIRFRIKTLQIRKTKITVYCPFFMGREEGEAQWKLQQT